MLTINELASAFRAAVNALEFGIAADVLEDAIRAGVPHGPIVGRADCHMTEPFYWLLSGVDNPTTCEVFAVLSTASAVLEAIGKREEMLRLTWADTMFLHYHRDGMVTMKWYGKVEASCKPGNEYNGALRIARHLVRHPRFVNRQ